MKTTLFILGILFFIACSNEKLERTNQLLAKNEIAITEEMDAALQEAIQEHIAIQAGNPNTKSLPVEFQFPSTQEEFAALEFTTLPLYRFDYRVFLENPSAEQLSKAILPAEDEMIFLAKRDRRMTLLMGIEQDAQGEWHKNNLGKNEFYFNRDFALLPELLEKIDGNEFYCLDYFGHLKLVYKQNGETFFAGTINGGNAETEKEFAKGALRLSQYTKENLERIAQYKEGIQ